jgi:hypothetical protein
MTYITQNRTIGVKKDVINPIKLYPDVTILADINKLDCSKFSHAAIDAEWYKKFFLTKQITFANADLRPKRTVVLWNKKYPLPTEYPALDHPLYIILIDENTSIIDVLKTALKLLVYIFYSPKDLTAFFGREDFTEILSRKNVPLSKLRNITGKFIHKGTEFTIQDTLGLTNSALEQLLESVGIDITDSKLLAKGRDKGKMEEWILDNPNTFLKYAIGDTIDLMKAIPLRVEQINTIINNALPHNLGNYTTDTIKFSSGSLVNDVFIRWFAHEYPEVYQVTLKQSQSNDNKAWKVIKEMRDKMVAQLDPSTLLEINKKLRNEKAVNGLAAGSINGIGIGRTNTGLFGTVVQGGRCINEEPHIDPYQNRIDNVIDIDLSSCYGSALRKLNLPVGLPTVYGTDIDDKLLTTEEFLKLYKRELVDGLWVIYVSGTLEKSSQDLIFSKYKLSTKTILKKLFTDFEDSGDDFDGWGREVEKAHMGGDFALTKKQLELGIITSEILEAIIAIATPQELKEWMNLSVVAAVFYPKSLEVGIDEWAGVINKNPGYKTADKDTRNRKWARIPLDGFIGKFIDYRKSVKATIVNKGDTADLIQNSVKLFINTTYGCLAAPYFEMGNTVIANNITARARLGVWMISKALLTVQSITDGGMFSGDRVAVINGNKPGFTRLANRQKMLSTRGIETTNLIDIDTKRELVTTGRGKELDQICKEHIDNFWSRYGLKMPFDIECKYDNCGDKAVYFGSSDYIIDVKSLGKKDYEIKCRGAKEVDHPKKLWLSHLLDPSHPVPPIAFPYTEIVGFNDYLKDKPKYQKLGVLPGDDIESVTYHRPYKNGQTFNDESKLKKFEESKRNAERTWDKTDRSKPFGLAAKVAGLSYPTSIDTVSV